MYRPFRSHSVFAASKAFASRSVPTSKRLGSSSSPSSAALTKKKARIGNPTQLRLFSVVSPLRSTDTGSSTKIRSRLSRFAGTTLIAIVAFTAGFLFQTQRTISRIMAEPIPLDEKDTTEVLDEPSLNIENYINSHPLTVSLREHSEFTESRPHTAIPEGLRPRNLTAGTLAGPEKIVIPPYMFNETGGKSLVSIFYLGTDVCGHPGIVHGGLLATLLDEGLARCCFPALPSKVAVTANLNIDYRRPAMAGSYYVLRAETVKVEGRKAWVEGRIESLPLPGKEEEPAVLVEAKALFIEPKQAAAMASIYKTES